jgi:hypothetical protein
VTGGRHLVRERLSVGACGHRAQRWPGEREAGGLEGRDERGLLFVARRTLWDRGRLEPSRLRKPVERGLGSSRSAQHHEARERRADSEPVLESARVEHRLTRPDIDRLGAAQERDLSLEDDVCLVLARVDVDGGLGPGRTRTSASDACPAVWSAVTCQVKRLPAKSSGSRVVIVVMCPSCRQEREKEKTDPRLD